MDKSNNGKFKNKKKKLKNSKTQEGRTLLTI